MNTEWISVEKELPKNDTSVLGHTKYKDIFVMYYDKDESCWYDSMEHYNIANITHWMYLPEPPKV